MKYQMSPKWDQYRPEYLKVGFIVAIGFALMAFNYTTYPNDEPYELEYGITEDTTLEIIPPRTPSEPKKMPLPPNPKIETLLEDILEEEPIFEEPKVDEIFDEEKSDMEVIIDDYTPPVKNEAPIKVSPIVNDNPIEESGPIIFADRMPVYGECSLDADEKIRRACTNKSIMSSLYSHVKYPAVARENEIEGTVVVSFIVAKDGSIQNLEIMRDIGAGCGDAVLVAMKKLGKFYPGKHNGRPVSVIYKLPVKFKLQ